MSDTEAQTTDETVDSAEKLQAELENQIGKFAKLFSMLDSNEGSESATALKMLKANMRKINELQEKLTGSNAGLSFVSLLDKIENGGGGGSEQIAEYEQMIAEYEAANETLKQAELLLRNELDRVQLIAKYGKADNIEDIDLNERAQKTLAKAKDALERMQTVLVSQTQDADGLYNAVLDEVLQKDMGDVSGEKLAIRHKIFRGLLRGMNYPVDADDAVRLQALTAAQAQMLKDTEDLQEKIGALRDSLPELKEALDIAIYQSGEHPDLTRAVDEMKNAVRQVEALRHENARISQDAQQMRMEFQNQLSRAQNNIRSLTHQRDRLDTRMLELLNDIDGGKNPIPKKPEAKPKTGKAAAEDFANRTDKYRKEAIDWTEPQALRARLTALAGRGYKIRLGNTFNPVTVDDVVRENHELHAMLLR
ncbi:MAG: hypothetical protein KKA05_06210, partial [Alphaproteobacteria bacterium]|nr:hypothetical protein [Alphaproteobacteria bacterium]